MNSEIDLNHFGASSSDTPKPIGLVGPSRHLISRYVLPLVLLAGFAGVGYFTFRKSFTRPVMIMVTVPMAAVQAIGNDADVPAFKAEKKSLFQAPGWIEPEPYTIKVSALRIGTVESVGVLEGETVTSGTVIAQLVDDDARLEIANARNALKLKQAKYQGALDRWKSPTTLVESVATARANGQKLQAEARRLKELLDLAKVEADVGKSLSNSGYEASLDTLRKKTDLIVSRNQLAETQAEINLNSATLTAATERLSLRIEDKEAVDSAQAEYLAAQTSLEIAQLALERCVIRAPTSGTIMRVMVSPGSMVSNQMENGMLLATLYQPDKLQVRADVPLSEAAKVRPGLAAEITVEALPGKVFRGELVNIVPEFDLQKNVLPVKVRIYDAVQVLRPEMIARVEFIQEASKISVKHRQGRDTGAGDVNSTAPVTAAAGTQAVLIPAQDVLGKGEQTYVMVAGADGRAHKRQIAAGSPASDNMVTVRRGLSQLDKVVVSPGDTVQEGTPIQIKGLSNDATH